MASEHEEIVIRTGRESGLAVIVVVHSSAPGQALGGCRMVRYPSWRDGLLDALRLAEAMTLKAALAGLPYGGGKSVVVLPRDGDLVPHRRRAAMLDVGDMVDSLAGRYGVGEDVGTTAEDMQVVRERTRWAYCLPRSAGGVGDTAEPTARGVLAAIRATCAHVFGTPEVSGRRFTVLGLGQVGGRIAVRLAESGAALLVSDIDPAKRVLADRWGAQWVEPDAAVCAPADVLVPAALGGVLTLGLAPRLDCAAVVGPANNQLAEPAVADALHRAGVLWAPDFAVGAGGVIYGALVDVAGRSAAEAWSRVDAIGETLRTVFARAAAGGVTPAAAAADLAWQRFHEAARRR